MGWSLWNGFDDASVTINASTDLPFYTLNTPPNNNIPDFETDDIVTVEVDVTAAGVDPHSVILNWDDSLAAWWRGEADMADFSGNNNNGIFIQRLILPREQRPLPILISHGIMIRQTLSMEMLFPGGGVMMVLRSRING